MSNSAFTVGGSSTGAAQATVQYNVTQVIQSSFNVSSVVSISAGINTINFTSALTSAEYIGLHSVGNDDATTCLSVGPFAAPTTTAFKLYTFAWNDGADTNYAYTSFAAF